MESSELGQYADGFVAWLGRLGYSPKTCQAQVALLRHLGRWLAQQRVPLSGLSSEVAGEYAAVRRGRVQLRSERALRPVLSYLRELGAVPTAAAVVPHEPVDVLLARFGGWLSRERGLARRPPPLSRATCGSGNSTPRTAPPPCSSARQAGASAAAWPTRPSGRWPPDAAWNPGLAAGPRDCTISGIPSRSARLSTRTARAATWTPAPRSCPPISGTLRHPIRTGT